VFSHYYENKDEDAKKQALLEIENKKKQDALEEESKEFILKSMLV
jgi:hypothetical protein